MPMTVFNAGNSSIAGRHQTMTVLSSTDMTIRLYTAATAPTSLPMALNTSVLDTITTSNQFGAILVWQTSPDSDHSFLHSTATAKTITTTPVKVITVALQTPAGTYEPPAMQTLIGSTIAIRDSLGELSIDSTTLFTRQSSCSFTSSLPSSHITQLQSLITQHSFFGPGNTVHSFTDRILSFEILDIRLIAAWCESPGVSSLGSTTFATFAHICHSFRLLGGSLRATTFIHQLSLPGWAA